MNSRLRIKTALSGGKPDRVPLVNVFSLPYLQSRLGMRDSIIKAFMENPGILIDFQEQVGHDPLINLYWPQEPEIAVWPEAMIRWDEGEWHVAETVTERVETYRVIERVIHTPRGSMTSVIRRGECQNWVLKHPFEDDTPLELLDYRPAPASMDLSAIQEYIQAAGDRAFSVMTIPGVWQEACALRGLDRLVCDLFDRKEWVLELLERLADYSAAAAQRVAETGLDCIMINESYVGMGMSPETFEDVILPFDKQIIDAIKKTGCLCSYHVCGKSARLLKTIAGSGVDAIETLSPPELAGDVDLAAAKEEVGQQVALWGGFNERVLASGSRDAIAAEARRCLAAAADGGGYVLRGSGQVYEAMDDALMELAQVVQEHGVY